MICLSEKGLIVMVLIAVQKKMMKESYKHREIVGVLLERMIEMIWIFLVNELVEEEIRNGILAERIVRFRIVFESCIEREDSPSRLSEDFQCE